MLHIILLFLKIIGIVILALFGILLGLVLLVSFVPIRYEVQGENVEKLTIQGKVSWLFRTLFIKVLYIENKFQYKVKLFGFTILDSLKPRKKKKVQKNKPKKIKKIKKKKEKKKALPKNNKKSKLENQNIIPDKSENKVQDSVIIDTKTKIKDNIHIDTHNNIEENIQIDTQTKIKDNVQTTTQSSSKQIKTIIKVEEKIQVDTDQQEDFHTTEEDFEQSTESEEGLNQNTKGLWNKNKIFFHKIKKLYYKIKNLYYKIKNLYYKIKASLSIWKEKLSRIREIKNIILEFIRDDEVRAGIKAIFASLLKILKHIKPKILKADVEFGTGDPCSTGQALAVLGILFSYYGEYVQITPNFIEVVYKGKLYAKGRIRLFTLLIICIKLIREKEFKYLVERMKKIKEEL